MTRTRSEAPGAALRSLQVLAPTGPEVLETAAELLPTVTFNGRTVRFADLGTALFAAVGAPYHDEHRRRRLADEASDLFVAHLEEIGEIGLQPPARPSLRDWVLSYDLAGVRQALGAAARYWRAELHAAMTAPAAPVASRYAPAGSEVVPAPAYTRTRSDPLGRVSTSPRVRWRAREVGAMEPR